MIIITTTLEGAQQRGVLLVGLDAPGKGDQEVHEVGAVEVLAQLVEHEPVAARAGAHVRLDLLDVVVALEVAVHPHVQHPEAHPVRVGLKSRWEISDQQQQVKSAAATIKRISFIYLLFVFLPAQV